MNKKLKTYVWKTIGLILFSTFIVSSVNADSRTYTVNADFDEGSMVGVQYDTVADQLQLTEQATTYPVMWIANAGEDSLSKWDTENNVELARYHTWFGALGSHNAWSGPAPSRTCVDKHGNCYVANRHFDNKPADVIKVLVDEWIDRNGNGTLDTAYDANSDGTISSDEMLPMTDSNGNGRIDDDEITDERIAWVATVGPNNGLGRSLALDLEGNIWLGLYSSRCYYKLSGVDGSVLDGPISVNGTPYGALIDKNGILWGSNFNNYITKLDTNDNSTSLISHSWLESGYGIALGYDDSDNTVVFVASISGHSFLRYNSGTGTWDAPAALQFCALGVATDSDGNVCVSNYYTGAAAKFTADGATIWSANAQVVSEARGTVVDSNNDVWVVHREASRLSKFDGANGSHLGIYYSGLYPYTYSDATGLGLRGSVEPLGTWTVIVDSNETNSIWEQVSWTSAEPDGTSVTVQVRSSVDSISWSDWESAANGIGLTETPDGQYLEIKTTLQITDGGEISPVLFDLTVTSNQSFCGDLDHDGDVDGDDRNILRGALRTHTGDAGFIEEADYDEDGDIDYSDYREWYKCYKAFISG